MAAGSRIWRGPERWGMHLEFQLEPDRRVLTGWFLKNAALTAQLGIPVILTVVYLTRGRRARFPAACIARGGKLRNRFQFETIHLWEHAERIRSGELRELAPLLVLCENNPTEATLREERELILGLPGPTQVRNELLAIAVMVGTRYFGRERLLDLFREEMAMPKEASVIQEWIDEGEARGRAEGEARGQAEGEARGRVEEARRVALRLLEGQFGELPAAVVERVEAADAEWCEELAVRMLRARSLEDLGLRVRLSRGNSFAREARGRTRTGEHGWPDRFLEQTVAERTSFPFGFRVVSRGSRAEDLRP